MSKVRLISIGAIVIIMLLTFCEKSECGGPIISSMSLHSFPISAPSICLCPDCPDVTETECDCEDVLVIYEDKHGTSPPRRCCLRE